MVANLSSHKVGWDYKIEYFSIHAEKGQALKDTLISLVDADTNAFNKIMDALKMPKNSDEEKKQRKMAMHAATIGAIEVPLKVMNVSLQSMTMLLEMAKNGNPNSVSDAGVGALCARTAVEGACLNVRLNFSGFDDKPFVENALKQADVMLGKAKEMEQEIMEIVLQLVQ